MSVETYRWIGGAVAVAQVTTLTPGSVSIGSTFTATINGKSITYTAAAATVTDACNGLQALLAASTIPEFAKITFATGGSTITCTGPATGEPFTITVSHGGTGSPTFTAATGTAASGPNWIDNGANYRKLSDGSVGALPVANDILVIDSGAVPLLYGDRSAVTLGKLLQYQSYTGTFGLPKTNASGYPEYLPDFLRMPATNTILGIGSGTGSGRIKLDYGAVQATIEVQGCGNAIDQGQEVVQIKGTHASNSITTKGSQTIVGIATGGGDVATFAAVLNQGATVRCGDGVTFPAGCNVSNMSGNISIRSAIGGTYTHNDGQCSISGSGAIGTLDISGGTVDHQGTGTIGALYVGPGTLSRTKDDRPLTSSSTTLRPGGKIEDPTQSITHTALARSGTVKTLTAA